MGRASTAALRAPGRWLALASLGVWLYFVSQLSQAYLPAFADGAGLSLDDAGRVLRIGSNLGQLLFFAGIVAALWRANRAAGRSGSGVRGLVVGSAGTAILGILEGLLLTDWYRVPLISGAAVDAIAPVASPFGVALALTGIASLVVSLTRTVGLLSGQAATPASSATSPAFERSGELGSTEGH